jgi:hypothetical protein
MKSLVNLIGIGTLAVVVLGFWGVVVLGAVVAADRLLPGRG